MMATEDRVDSLKAKHKQLEVEIDQEMHRPLPDYSHITELKREKLRIKDTLALLSPR
jgi:hypothetical protein